MNDAGDSQVVQESPRESLFKDRYFVSGCCIGSGSGIAKRFKDLAQVYNFNTINDILNITLNLC